MKQLKFGQLVEAASELPDLRGKTLYLDLETTSGHPELDSKSPWRNCTICGIALKSDGSEYYYVPVKHNGIYAGYNLPREEVISWLAKVFNNHEQWVNQNVKYDAHVVHNDFGLDFPGDLVCTIHALAAPHDSERVYKGGYGLDVLARDILGEDITGWEKDLQKYLTHSKDYGDIHPEVCGSYANKDVDIVFRLRKALPPKQITGLEVQVTKALLEMERVGFYVDMPQVEVEDIKATIEMYSCEKEIFELLGCKYYLNPASSKQMKTVFVDYLGLPILGWTDEDKVSPSFASKVLEDYIGVEGVPDGLVEACLKYREWKTYQGLFLKAFVELNQNGLLRPWYNQTVRSGRMSCSKPNAQQQNELSKTLIVPRPGCGFARYDYSQIEFRIIAEYINWKQEYIQDPDSDFYTGVSKLAGCDRDAAKVISLGAAYGMGEKATVRNLSRFKSVKDRAETFLRECGMSPTSQQISSKANEFSSEAFRQFHKNLPSLKATASKAQAVCESRGYVKTMMGRERHLGSKFSRKAFNTVCQGSAADLLKLKVIEFIDVLRKFPEINLILQVHDELAFEAPVEILRDPRFHRDVIAIMERNSLPMEVPLRAHGGWSEVNLAFAKPPKPPEAIQNPVGTKGENFSWI